MPTSSLSEVIQHLSSAMLRDWSNLTDAQLLECFVSRCERAAIEVLVRRHAPMVWGVCRRMLGNDHDAEDAFQATFLVLVRKAATIRTNAGNWLYGVAHQTARKARATRAKRQARERQVTQMPELAATECDVWNDLQTLLDQELSQLPEKYRAVIVLCDLAGKSGSEAARELSCAEGTVASRLSRGRAMLAKRLQRRGLTVTAGSVAALLPQQVSSCVPDAVMSSTTRAVTLVAAGQATTEAIAGTVVALTEGVMKAMLLNKIKTALALLLVGVLCVSAVGWTHQMPASGANPDSTRMPGTSKANSSDELKSNKPAETAQAAKPADIRPVLADLMLEQALSDPSIFMFGETASSKTDPNAPRGFDLVITSARNVKGEREIVHVRPGTMRIFRADDTVDEFTKQGGWYWKCGDQKGKTQFKEAGALILVVRLQDGTVQWYSLQVDLRC